MALVCVVVALSLRELLLQLPDILHHLSHIAGKWSCLPHPEWAGHTRPNISRGGRGKNVAFSVFGGTAPGDFVIGAVFPAMFAEFARRAWAYWVLAIICLVLAIVSFFIVPGQSREASRNERFDFLGSITGVTGLVLFNIAWNQDPSIG
jgi:hypothetical protein